MSLRDDLLECSRDAVAELRGKSIQARDEAIDIGLEVLVLSDAKSHWRFAMELLHLLEELMGKEALQAWIVAEWASMSPSARGNIAYAIADPELFDNTMIARLFDHPTSTVMDRHSIAGALCMSVGPREAQALLSGMSGRIGVYPDKYRQRILDKFLAGLRADLAGWKSKE